MASFLETHTLVTFTQGEGRTTDVDTTSNKSAQVTESNKGAVVQTTTPDGDSLKTATRYDDYAYNLTFSIPMYGGLGNPLPGDATEDPCA